MDLEYITQNALAHVEDAAEYIRSERARWSLEDLRFKGDNSLVTSIDVGVEKLLMDRMKELVPDAGWLAEETASQASSGGLLWILDPVDGTTNLVHNFPMYCISLALQKEGRIVVGIVYEVNSRECFWAFDGQDGAYLNNSRIYVSKSPTIERSVLATGFPPGAFAQMENYLHQFRAFMGDCQGLRRLGTAALDLAYVACGRCDGFFEYELKPWDVAAGSYIVQKAGGKVTDFGGGENFLFGKQILASNGLIHEEFRKYFTE